MSRLGKVQTSHIEVLPGSWEHDQAPSRAGRRKRSPPDVSERTQSRPGRCQEGAVPGKLSSQLATLAKAAPTVRDWLYEIKLDGYRIPTRIDDGTIDPPRRGRLDGKEEGAGRGAFREQESLQCRRTSQHIYCIDPAITFVVLLSGANRTLSLPTVFAGATYAGRTSKPFLRRRTGTRSRS